MDRQQRSNLAIGVVLILLGAFFLLVRFTDWSIALENQWPLIVIGVGALLLIIGVVTGVPDMAVPACIVGGIGGILLYQNTTGDWGSWAYMWALIPGFSGVGIVLGSLLGGRERLSIRSGLETIIGSLVLFCVFGFFLGPFKELGTFAPLLLVAAGLLIIGRSFILKR
jgi:hypothetical protein